MKHKPVEDMLQHPNELLADDIAQYAIFNTSDNDNTKHKNIVDLILAYTKSVTQNKQQNGKD